ncbi:NXPE family member 3-like [Branchiostoma floridae]|uniref:NXPE family member 3-like n=1 Tax=Branchiostoma floridae TaxID=7739 RepID=A0A9J7N9R0_BRAFL|nr:NXPE family member 3-like [Branchiostoma floridae]
MMAMRFRRLTAAFGTLSLVVLLAVNGTFYYTRMQNDTHNSRQPLRLPAFRENELQENEPMEEETSPLEAEAIYPDIPAHEKQSPTEQDTREQVTHPHFTKFAVLNTQRGYRQGDVLTAVIQARDASGRPKTYGGDFFRAKLVSVRPREASSAGHVTDHGNGTYTVQFPLYWTGEARVSVQLVHPSEAVKVLRRVRDVPAKRSFTCMFIDAKSGDREKRPCFTAQPPELPPERLCDFSRHEANGTWFCEKPESLPCDAIVACRREVSLKTDQPTILVSEDEWKLFLSPYVDTELEQDDPVVINVKESEQPLTDRLPECSGQAPDAMTNGYWSGNGWNSTVCNVRQFTRTDMRRCVANKTLYLQGDSTIRKWFQWFAGKEQSRHKGSLKGGPAILSDKDSNSVVTYRAHGLPVLGSEWMNISKIRYIADELDSIKGGPDTLIVLGLGAQFTTEPIEMFRARLYAIQNAIRRLLQRSPGTRVFVRTGTTRDHKSQRLYLRGSDWLAYQIVQEIRQIFGPDRNAVVLDTWDMSVCQWEVENLHNGTAMMDAQMNMFLSHICPKA